MTNHISNQKIPQPGDKIVLDHVVSDIIMRAHVGKEKYGTFLMTNNGRNPLVDAYQEALDLVVYLKQALLEQDEKNNVPDLYTVVWKSGSVSVLSKLELEQLNPMLKVQINFFTPGAIVRYEITEE